VLRHAGFHVAIVNCRRRVVPATLGSVKARISDTIDVQRVIRAFRRLGALPVHVPATSPARRSPPGDPGEYEIVEMGFNPDYVAVLAEFSNGEVEALSVLLSFEPGWRLLVEPARAFAAQTRSRTFRRQLARMGDAAAPLRRVLAQMRKQFLGPTRPRSKESALCDALAKAGVRPVDIARLLVALGVDKTFQDGDGVEDDERGRHRVQTRLDRRAKRAPTPRP